MKQEKTGSTKRYSKYKGKWVSEMEPTWLCHIQKFSDFPALRTLGSSVFTDFLCPKHLSAHSSLLYWLRFRVRYQIDRELKDKV